MFLYSSFTSITGLFISYTGRSLRKGVVTFVPATDLARPVQFCMGGKGGTLRRTKVVIRRIRVARLPGRRVSSVLRGYSCVCVANKGAFFLLRRLGEGNISGVVSGRIGLNGLCVKRSTKTVVTSPSTRCVEDIGFSPVRGTPRLGSYASLSLISFCAVPRCKGFPFGGGNRGVIRLCGRGLRLVPVDGGRTIVVRSSGVRVGSTG